MSTAGQKYVQKRSSSFVAGSVASRVATSQAAVITTANAPPPRHTQPQAATMSRVAATNAPRLRVDEPQRAANSVRNDRAGRRIGAFARAGALGHRARHAAVIHAKQPAAERVGEHRARGHAEGQHAREGDGDRIDGLAHVRRRIVRKSGSEPQKLCAGPRIIRVSDRSGRIGLQAYMQDLLEARRKRRRPPEAAKGDDRGLGVVDRRSYHRVAARGAGRLGVLPGRRGAVHAAGRHALRDFDETLLKGARSATEENALLRAQVARERFQATWGLGETGAAGPTGNRYGDPAGHTCIAVAGAVRVSRTLRTNSSERLENMYAFAAAALTLLEEVLTEKREL